VPRLFLDHRENQQPQLAIVEGSVFAAPATPAAMVGPPVFTVGGILTGKRVLVVSSPATTSMRLVGVQTAFAVSVYVSHDLRYRSRYIVCQDISRYVGKPVADLLQDDLITISAASTSGSDLSGDGIGQDGLEPRGQTPATSCRLSPP
jgi:hypothetical protein